MGCRMEVGREMGHRGCGERLRCAGNPHGPDFVMASQEYARAKAREAVQPKDVRCLICYLYTSTILKSKGSSQMCSGRVWEGGNLGQAGECVEKGHVGIWVRGSGRAEPAWGGRATLGRCALRQGRRSGKTLSAWDVGLLAEAEPCCGRGQGSDHVAATLHTVYIFRCAYSHRSGHYIFIYMHVHIVYMHIHTCVCAHIHRCIYNTNIYLHMHIFI